MHRRCLWAGPLLVAAVAGGLVSAPAGAAPEGAAQDVIVLLADRQPLVDQVPLLGEVHAASVRRFSVLNGFAAKLTGADRARLAADPRVKAVVPDLIVKRAKPVVAEHDSPAAAAAPPVGAACPADPAKPLLEPEALDLTHAPDAQKVATGKGVKVAYLAGGVDPANPEFQRPDGSPVFADYHDFSGEGLDAPAPGTEAFGDASAIAAQGSGTYDLSGYVNPASPLPKGCTIRIRGMAPGASLVGLKTDGENGSATSAIIAAIDYAVNVAKVDVINESLGSNPYPDRRTDPFSLANDAAVRAGVTVVGASGDAGFGNTIGDPAGAPDVISVGASTSFRLFAQTQRNLPGLSGKWNSGNISSLSSTGVTEDAATVDLTAPGDAGWAVCTADATKFPDCRNFRGKPSPFVNFSGTSQAAPFVAGAAALVIEAYSSAHYGAKPSPALVKQLLTGTAADQDDRATQQGAGLVNAYQAVLAAKSVKDSNGGSPQGDNLITKQTQLSATKAAGSTVDFPVQVTNAGSHVQLVTPGTRTLTKVLADQRGQVSLDASAAGTPKWTSGTGSTFGFVTKTFTVAAGAKHLEISHAFSPAGGSAVSVRLLDPHGALTAVSAAQGDSGFGHLDVHDPAAGTWTAVFDSKTYHGAIPFDVRTSTFVSAGSVTPAVALLAPGQTATFHVSAKTPAAPGDLGAAVEFHGSYGGHVVVPMVLRSLVSGPFTGVLAGGNGRDAVAAQNSYYQFDVPAGRHDFSLGLTLAGDPGQLIFGYLVSPDGQLLSQQNNVASLDDQGNPASFGRSLQVFRRDPAPGRWTLIVSVSNPVAGTTTEQNFSGSLKFDSADVRASGLPDGATLPAGKPVTATITVHNTGVAPESFFADPRTTKTGDLRLHANGPETGLPLPAGPLFYTVPPATTALTATATSANPVSVTLQGIVGGSQVLGDGHPAKATVASPEVSPGAWLVGAEQSGASKAGTADLALTATTQLFDAAATSSTGDIWLASTAPGPPAFTPLVLQPGQSGTLTVTLKPGAAKGTKVSGVLYVDDYSEFATTGDELKAFPYSYTVG